MGTGVPVGIAGPGGRWTSGNVPASASLYSMASGSSSISGWYSLFFFHSVEICNISFGIEIHSYGRE